MATPSRFRHARRSALGACVVAALVAFPATPAFASLVESDASPFTKAHSRTSAGFTVLVERDADIGRRGGEIEGSLAVGGTLSFGTYNLNANKDGSQMPTADAPGTQLLTGASVVTAEGTQKLDVNAGRAAIGDVSGMLTTADGRLTRPNDAGYVLSSAEPRQSTVDDYAALGVFDAVFPSGYFEKVRTDAAAMSELAGNGAAQPEVERDADRLKLTLTAGETNVWTVAHDGFAGLNEVSFSGATPSASTPLVINVLPGATADFSPARFLGDGTRSFAPWVTWNFDGWEELRLVGSMEMGGLLVAPDAALDYHRENPFRGQLVVESLAITAAGEIHHYEHPGVPVEPTDPTDPTNPTGPTDPADPTDPTDPRDPTVPTEPNDPTGPSHPTVPTDVTQSHDASDPDVSVPAQGVLASTGFDAAVVVAGSTLVLAGLGVLLVVRRRQRA